MLKIVAALSITVAGAGTAGAADLPEKGPYVWEDCLTDRDCLATIEPGPFGFLGPLRLNLALARKDGTVECPQMADLREVGDTYVGTLQGTPTEVTVHRSDAGIRLTGRNMGGDICTAWLGNGNKFVGETLETAHDYVPKAR